MISSSETERRVDDMEQKRDEIDLDRLEADAYGAYLIALTSGKKPIYTGNSPVYLMERYAAALGLDHHRSGCAPLHMRELVDLARKACGEVPPTVERSKNYEELTRLAEFILATWPGEFGPDAPAETVVSAAIWRIAWLEKELEATRAELANKACGETPSDEGKSKDSEELARLSEFVREQWPYEVERGAAHRSPVDAVVLGVVELQKKHLGDLGLFASLASKVDELNLFVEKRLSPPALEVHRTREGKIDDALSLLKELAVLRATKCIPLEIAREERDRAVAEERRKCAEFVRKWPNAHKSFLAQSIEEGKHVEGPSAEEVQRALNGRLDSEPLPGLWNTFLATKAEEGIRHAGEDGLAVHSSIGRFDGPVSAPYADIHVDVGAEKGYVFSVRGLTRRGVDWVSKYPGSNTSGNPAVKRVEMKFPEPWVEFPSMTGYETTDAAILDGLGVCCDRRDAPSRSHYNPPPDVHVDTDGYLNKPAKVRALTARGAEWIAEKLRGSRKCVTGCVHTDGPAHSGPCAVTPTSFHPS